MEQSSLPLRLAAEPYVRRIKHHCFILPTKQEERICIVISNEGIIAAICDQYISPPELASLLEIASDALPPVQFAFNTKQWFDLQRNEIPEKDVMMTIAPVQNVLCLSNHCARVIEGIFRYYSRQVLEPSIRGFLSILEKTFPRNDLYLFELLQNAVDDGAMNVSFTSKSGGLSFIHDGRPFTPMDCLGLSSVGLSTKGSDGNKRTIGFMGIGFKAVYKRYAKVTVYDNQWSFAFNEPTQPEPLEPSHGWVLKPIWCADRTALWDSQSDSPTAKWCHFQLERPRGGSSCVHDDLKYLPITIPSLLGKQAIANYLHSKGQDKVDSTPSSPPTWSLEWNQTTHKVSILPSSNQQLLARQEDVANQKLTTYSLSSETVQVAQSEPGYQKRSVHPTPASSRSYENRTRYWQFISLHFTPNKAAQEAYEVHTKRPWSSPSGEETCLFFEVNESGAPIASMSGPSHHDNRGHIHAVLPTKLKLPTALQWQGSWLLSIDRQEVQNITDNTWNQYLLLQLPKLLTGLLLWTSKLVTPQALDAAYSLIPPMTIIEEEVEILMTTAWSGNSSHKHHSRAAVQSGNKTQKQTMTKRTLSVQVLGSKISLDEVMTVLKSNVPLVPTASPDSSSSIVKFIRANEAMWLPPPFTRRLSHNTLATWFGISPICSNLLNLQTSFLPLWKVLLARPTAQLLDARVKHLETVLQATAAAQVGAEPQDLPVEVEITLIQLMAAIGESLSLSVPDMAGGDVTLDGHNNSSNNNTANKHSKGPRPQTANSVAVDPASLSMDLCGDWLPSLQHWPVFLGDDKLMHKANEMTYWLGPDFDTVPADIREILNEGIRSQLTSKSVLHRKLLAILSLDFSFASVDGQTLSYARQALIAARNHVLTHQNTKIIGIERAADMLFESWSKDPSKASSSIASCLRLFNWAMKAQKPQVITHVLVDDTSLLKAAGNDASTSFMQPVRVVKSSQAYLGRAYLSSDGSDIEALFAPYISSGTQQQQQQQSNSRNSTVPHVAFVASLYLPHTEMTARELKPYLDFLIACGVQTGVSLVGKSRHIANDSAPEVAFLKDKELPKLRSSNTNCDIYLPYGLGPLSRKDHILVDIAFAPEWQALLASLSSNVTRATTFATLVTKMFLHLDMATNASPESTPAAAVALQGKSSDAIMIASNRVDCQSHIPGVARLFFLPPGQPGASAVSVGLAEWLKTLSQAKWVPAAGPGANPSDPATLVLRPCEVALTAPAAVSAAGSGSKVSLLSSSSQIRDEMPSIRLSPVIQSILRNASPLIQDCFKWGTEKPAPPLNRLEELGQLTVDAEQSGMNQYYYDELVSIWRALVVAYQDGRLSSGDCSRIRRVVLGDAQSKGPVIPAFRKLWSGKQCFNIKITQTISDEELSGLLICRARLALNLAPEECDSQWELAAVASVMVAIIQPPKVPSKEIIEHFISWCGSAMPSPLSHPNDWQHIRNGYSFALWTLVKRFISPNEQDVSSVTISESSCVAAAKHLKQLFPGLKVFCARGPGATQQAFHARWLEVWPAVPTAAVTPVLIDDLTSTNSNSSSHHQQSATNTAISGITKSSLLEPDHLYQPLGILNHGFSQLHYDLRDESNLSNIVSAAKVMAINRKILDILQIPRISDKKHFSLKVFTNKSCTILKDSLPRLEVVLLLVQSALSATIVSSHYGHYDINNLNVELKLPPLFKHDTLAVSFKTPKMNDFQKRKVFALWGAIPSSFVIDSASRGATATELPLGFNFHPSKAMLLSGDSDDYAPELEDLLLQYICDAMRIKRAQIESKPEHELRLVAFLEDKEKFLKHFRRSFDGYLKVPQQVSSDVLVPDNAEAVLQSQLSARLTALLEKIDPVLESSPALKRSRPEEVPAVKDTIDPHTAAQNSQCAQELIEGILLNAPPSTARMSRLGISNLRAWMTNPDLAQSISSDSKLPGDTINSGASSSNTELTKAPLLDHHSSSSEDSTRMKFSIENSMSHESLGSKYGPTSELPDTHVVTSESFANPPPRVARLGLSNLPAWMTAGATSTADVNPQKSASVSRLVSEEAAADTTSTAVIVDQATTDATTSTTTKLESARLARLGISNKPSWMTSGAAKVDITSSGSTNKIDGDTEAVSLATTELKGAVNNLSKKRSLDIVDGGEEGEITESMPAKKKANDRLQDELVSFFLHFSTLAPKQRADEQRIKVAKETVTGMLRLHSDLVSGPLMQLLSSHKVIRAAILELLQIVDDPSPLLVDYLKSNDASN